MEILFDKRPDIKIVYEHLKGLKNGSESEKKITEIIKRRRWMIDNYGSVNGKHPSVCEDVTVTKVRASGVNCEWICHKDADPDKRLLYMHGGAFFAGSLNSHRPLCALLSKLSGVSVLSVDYRLAPEHPFPAGLDDCFDAYEWLYNNSPLEKNVKAKKIFVAGDSAGGNLSIAILFKIRHSLTPYPDLVIPISPVLDFLGKSPSINENNRHEPIINKQALLLMLPIIYLYGKDFLKLKEVNKAVLPQVLSLWLKGRSRLANPLLSPIYGNPEGFPPISIHTGNMEMLRDDSVRFVEKARKHSVNAEVKIWPEMLHVFVAFKDYLPEAEACISEIAESMRNN